MGKKVQVVGADPILSKNYKYEKRNKTRLIEKQRMEEQKALEQQRSAVLQAVEAKVDQQIHAHSVPPPSQPLPHAALKRKMFAATHAPAATQARTSHKLVQIAIPLETASDPYSYHFGLQTKAEELEKERKTSRVQQIEEQTRQEIQSMFAQGQVQPKPELEMDQAEEAKRESEAFNLKPQFKVEKEVSLAGQVMQVSSKFSDNLSSLGGKSGDGPLAVSEVLVKGYFDHVFIENQQQQRIQDFRTVVVSHAVQHLERCLSEQKGRGFTNCKILILTPFLGDARAILELLEGHFPSFSIANKDKLDQLQDENDYFRIGIKLARKKSLLTYFSNFDHSEIIVASPVGLKAIIAGEGETKGETSFLSSVELLYVDRASVLLMQNWAHVIEVLRSLNFMPRYESLKNSIDSIREGFLELKGRLYRQNIVFSEFNFPELNALRRTHFHNIQGAATSKAFFAAPLASSNEQQFFKIELREPREDLQARFEYFKRKFWEDLMNKESLNHVVIFASSYFEYIKLKSFFEKVNASAQYVCEHTPAAKVQGRLARFNNGQHRILLLTERAHYFQICKARKISHIYFYSLPRNAFVYHDLLEQLQPLSTGNRVISIYTKFDSLVLQRIVGTAKSQEMVREYCNNVSFVL